MISKSRVLISSALFFALTGAAATSLPAPGARAISVNFASNQASLANLRGAVGAYSVDSSRWMNVSAKSNTGSSPTQTVAENLTDNAGVVYSATSLQSCSNGGNNYYNGSSDSLVGRLMYGYLDDSGGSNYAGFQLTGVPFRNYAVVVYFNTDSTSTNPFPAYRFNGTYYRGDSATGSTLSASEATEYWGVKSTTALAEGGNYLVVTGFDNTVNPNLTVEIPAGCGAGDGHRGTISGFQVIDTTPAAIETYTATITGPTAFSAIVWDGGKTWVNSPNANVALTLSGDAALTLDGSLTLRALTANGSGHSLSIKNATSSLTCAGFDLSGIGGLELSDETMGWLPPLIGASPVFLHTATEATITTQFDAIDELQAAAPGKYTVNYAGSEVRITGGVYSDFSAPATGTATALIISGNPTINTGTNKLEVGTMTVRIEGGTITTPSFYTTERANSRPCTITQTGGDIILTATGAGTSTTESAFMLGHWNYGKSVYNLEDGSIQAEKGGLRLSNDSEVDLNISGGLLAVAGINGKGYRTTTLTLSGGELRIGAGGFANLANCTFTLSGGMLSASASNTIAQPLILKEETTSTLSAAEGAIMKISSVGGGGALSIAGGSVEIPSAITVPISVAVGATLRVALTDGEAGVGKTMDKVTLSGGASIIFVKADGTTLANDSSGNVYTPAGSKTWRIADGTWKAGDASSNWSDGTAFANGGSVIFPNQSVPTVITVEGTVEPATLAIVGGNLTFTGGQIAIGTALAKTEAGTATFNQPVVPAKITIESGELAFTSTLGSGASFDKPLTIAKDTALHLTVAEGTTQKINLTGRTGSGLFSKSGAGTLETSNSNTSFTGITRVTEGTLKLTSGAQQNKGSVIEVVGPDAVIQLDVSNAMAHDETSGALKMVLADGARMVVNQRSAMRNRWEMNNATIFVTGNAGDTGSTVTRGFDFYYGPNLVVGAAADATPENPTRSLITAQAGGKFSAASIRHADPTFDIAENALLEIGLPLLRSSDSNTTPFGITKTGLGTLTFSAPGNAFFGTLNIKAGQVEVLNDSTPGAGPLTLVANTTLKLNAQEASQTLANTAITGSGTIAKQGAHTSTIPCAVDEAIAIATNEGTLELVIGEGLSRELPLGKRSGSGTLLKSGPGELRLTGTKAGLGLVRATEGTLTLDTPSDKGPLYGNSIEVSGDGTILRLSKENSTSWAATGTQSLLAKDGATIRLENRNAVYSTAWQLNGATVELNFKTTSEAVPRCLDFYGTGATLNVTAAPGATAANPTVSRIFDPNGIGGMVSTRIDAAIINVAANARLDIEAPMASYTASSYGFVKRGTGTLRLSNPGIIYLGPTTIEGGLFQLNGNHTGAGSYTIADGAALGGTGSLTLASAKTLTFSNGARLVKTSDAPEAALAVNGTIALPPAGESVAVELGFESELPRDMKYYLLKSTTLPADAAKRFSAPKPHLKIGQDATGLFIHRPTTGVLITFS